MAEYIIDEPFTIEISSTQYAKDFAKNVYVLTKVCEYGEKLNLEQIVRCRDCKYCVKAGGYLKDSLYCLNLDTHVDSDGYCSWGDENVRNL